MFDKGWSDQPDEVTSLPTVLRFNIGSTLVEVRKAAGLETCYVTVGNLFSSQTVRCSSSDAALTLVNQVVYADGHGQKVDVKEIPGVQLIPGPHVPS